MPRVLRFDSDDVEEVVEHTQLRADPLLVAAFQGRPVGRVECPVCRSHNPCTCSEDERAFVRRTRFEAEIERLPRCRVCGAPLSVVYLPRVVVVKGMGSSKPILKPAEGRLDLPHYGAVWGCACCQGAALASVLVAAEPR